MSTSPSEALPETLEERANAAIVRAARAGAASARRRSNSQRIPPHRRRSGRLIRGRAAVRRSGQRQRLAVGSHRLLHQTRCAARAEDDGRGTDRDDLQCLRAGPPSIIEKLDKGEPVDPASYYFRMNPMFETSAPKYDWINRIIAVGIGHRLADGPIYSIFEVL